MNLNMNSISRQTGFDGVTETDGDMEAAVDVLRKSGAAKVEKKAGRIAAEGITKSCIRKATQQ